MYNVELVEKLKDLEKTINTTEWKLVRPCSNPIKPKIDYIFQNLINVKTADIERLMKIFKDHNINERTKNMIISKLICIYDKENEYEGNLKRQRLVEKHLFKIIT
jgi:hypothetical protein